MYLLLIVNNKKKPESEWQTGKKLFYFLIMYFYFTVNVIFHQTDGDEHQQLCGPEQQVMRRSSESCSVWAGVLDGLAVGRARRCRSDRRAQIKRRGAARRSAEARADGTRTEPSRTPGRDMLPDPPTH